MTIEERAYKYALEHMPYEPFFSKWQETYKQIATEQHNIDIDKACGQFRFILGKICDPIIADALEEDFRKAMEE